MNNEKNNKYIQSVVNFYNNVGRDMGPYEFGILIRVVGECEIGPISQKDASTVAQYDIREVNRLIKQDDSDGVAAFIAKNLRILDLFTGTEINPMSPDTIEFLKSVFDYMYLVSKEIDTTDIRALVETITEEHVPTSHYRIEARDLNFLHACVYHRDWEDFLRKIQEISERPYDIVG